MKVNYHMHTARCGHAIGEDEAYILEAIKQGFEEVGFSDHAPWPFAPYPFEGMRMHVEELDGYIASIRALQEKYQDKITIKIGLECEYYQAYMPWLEKTIKEKGIDYIILGNHCQDSDLTGIYYGRQTTSKEVLHRYVDDVVAALETGLYSYVAHPDLIHYVASEDEVYTKEMERICVAAKACGKPLEFNLLGYYEKRQYPCPKFWELAAKHGCEAIIGYDAHAPYELARIQLFNEAESYLKSLNIKIVDKITFLK